MDGLRKVPDNVPNRDLLTPASRQAADPHPRSVRLARQLWRAQQRAAAGVPGLVRFRVRVRVVDRVLRRRPVRCGADPRAGMLRRGDGGDPADARTGAARDLFADPADPSATGRVMQVPMEQPRSRRRHGGLARSGQRRDVRNVGEGRRLQAAVEGRLGDALVCARRRLRDVGQGPDRLRAAVRAASAVSSAARRRKASPMNCSSTSTRRRSASRRATACRSRSGCATRRRRACRSSCSTRRSAPSGCIST